MAARLSLDLTEQIYFKLKFCRLAELFCFMSFSSGTRGLPRAYSSHGDNRGIKGISSYHALIWLCPKAGKELRIPLAYLFLFISMDSLPQKFSTNFSVISSAGTGYPVQLQKSLWKRERDTTMALDKCLLSEWILTEMSNPPVGSNITFRNKQKAYPRLGKPCKKK